VGAQGGHQEVQGAAAAVPAGSPAPDGPPHAVMIDRSRALTRIVLAFCFHLFHHSSIHCIRTLVHALPVL
jgi:hypothetical protein